VSSALLVGQAGDKVDKDKKAPPPPPPAAVASSGGCCGQDACCDGGGFGRRLRDRLHGLFNRNNCDCCQPTTCHQHHVRSSCNDCCGQARVRHTHNNCSSGCNDGCGGGGFLGHLRERFRRGDCCGCDGGCSGAGAPPVKGGEKIDAPKKMPGDGKDKKTSQEVRIYDQGTPNGIRVTPTVPSVEVTPIPAPRVEDR
jgi:hypothetical protein